MLQARSEVMDNADPVLAVEAMEAMHNKDASGLSKFALQLHNMRAAHIYSVSVTTINFLTIKGLEKTLGDPNEYIQEVITYIQDNGVEIADCYSLDPAALNSEVGNYIKNTLFPVLNGEQNLSIDFPDETIEHTKQYILALTYVTYAFFVIAHRKITGNDDISFDGLIEHIENRIQQESAPIKTTMVVDPSVPFEPTETSHFGNINRSSFSSPAHEAMASVDIDIPLNLAKYYANSDREKLRAITQEILDGNLSLGDVLKPVLHFCRAVLVIVFNMTNGNERDSYMNAANSNITKARLEGLVTNRFDVSQNNLDSSTKYIMLSLSSLMSNSGAFYESKMPEMKEEKHGDILYSFVVSMGMITDAYSVLITGKLGLTNKEFIEYLHDVLS